IRRNVEPRDRGGVEKEVYSYLTAVTRHPVVHGSRTGAANFTASATRCRPSYALTMLIYLMGTVLISMFSALRVYALWQGSQMKYVFPTAVFVLGAIPVGTNIYNWMRTSIIYSETPPSLGCNEYTNVQPKLNTECVLLHMLIFTRSSLIASDVLVLVLTWIKSYPHWREMRRLKLSSSVSTVLLRDGIYLIPFHLPIHNESHRILSRHRLFSVSYHIMCVRNGCVSHMNPKCTSSHECSRTPDLLKHAPGAGNYRNPSLWEGSDLMSTGYLCEHLCPVHGKYLILRSAGWVSIAD
ncbi:uncharacterized protein PHACADRAFT_85378, partial [Phanerochaete carnosa HHB-10118-sp]